MFLTHDSKNATNSKRVFPLNKMGQVVHIKHYDRSKNIWNLIGQEHIIYNSLGKIDAFEFVVDNPSSTHHGDVHRATYTYDSQGRFATEIWNYKKSNTFIPKKTDSELVIP